MMKTKLKFFLILLAAMILVPQGVKAREYIYDFWNLANSCSNASGNIFGRAETLTLSNNAYSSAVMGGNVYYGISTTYGSTTVDMSRFALRSDVDASQGKGWYLCNSSHSNYNGCGLLYGKSEPNIAITNLRPNDVVEITFKGVLSTYSSSIVSLVFVSGSAVKTDETTLNANDILATYSEGDEAKATFKATAKGDVVIKTNGGERSTYITYIKITRPDASYNYDPAFEVYDLSGINTGEATTLSEGPGYRVGTSDAKFLASPTGISLNNRFAVSDNDFTWNNGLKTTKGSNQWRVLAIDNLRAGDRVVITYSGTAMEFGSSPSSNSDFAAAGIVFKDEDNNGDRDDGETYLQRGDHVESGMVYTMEKEGHLDIRVPGGALITKIEIIGDHQATMLDKYNGSATTGYTSYFNSTGQLMAKEHMNPGGLEIHVGNNNNTQHAIIVSSDQGPVSFVYDQENYKMARQENGNTDILNAPPATGTFYRFMPEVNGTMTVRFKARNIRYKNYRNGDGKTPDDNEVLIPNGTKTTNTEQINGQSINQYVCPYYLMVKKADNSFDRYRHPNDAIEYAHDHRTGDDGAFTNISVTAGNTYYLYGWWRDPSNWESSSNPSACGVAELIDVTFVPSNVVIPLAKSVAGGGDSYDNLAEVSGFSTVKLKKKSANILTCTPEIYTDESDGNKQKLRIKDITYVQGSNPGGTILVKVGDPSNESDPVFALTIAYDATKGHVWNFSDNPLNGLKWNNTSSEADVTPFKTANDNTGLLYAEMHKTGGRSDWTKNYRVKTGDDEGLDLMYLNKRAMEGNNANMIWETEGLIINTSSNQSAINNEYTDNSGVIDHTNTTDRPDPDRYVGILPGGEFIIPKLDAGDRVIIYMGSGKGSGTDAIYMNITNAKDAVGTPITSEYHVGGSLWQADSEEITQQHGTPYYKGAYHFIAAANGDMIFKLADKGTLAKLYSIKIYTGNHEHTNDLERAVRTYDKGDGNGSIDYNLDGYQFFNRYNDAAAKNGCFSMHWRGKGEGLSEPVVVHHTGNAAYDSNHLFHGTIGTNHFIFYKSEKNQYGLVRMRVDVKDLNGTYATDYGLQNIVVGCLDKMNYPYTWDFTDLMKYAYTDDTDKRIKKALSDASGYDEDTEFMDNAIVQWEYYDDALDAYDGYGLHMMNSAFSGEMVFPGQSQLYAGDQIIAETQGLDFIQMSTQQKRNGRLRITNSGLYLFEQNNEEPTPPDYWRIVIPEVPAGAAVYVRAKQLASRGIIANVGNRSTEFSYSTTSGDDYIYATSSSSGGDMTLFFSNVVLQKIAVSTDKKQLNPLGWASESRDHDIDAELTWYMTGKDIKTYMVSNVNNDAQTVTLADISYLRMPKVGVNVVNEEEVIDNSTINNACILRNTGGTALSLVDGGFHLFVPDMHDEAKWTPNVDSKMKAQLRPGTVPMWGNDAHTILNYAFTYQYVKVDPDTGIEKDTQSALQTGKQAFYRIVSQGATSTGNQGYLPVSTSASTSRFSIMFDGEDIGLATQIEPLQALDTEEAMGTERYYNLNGQQMSGKPNRNGLYIMNGKKVYINNK